MKRRTAILFAATVSVATFLTSNPSAQTFIGQNFTASRSDLDFLRPDVGGAAGTDYFVELSGGRYSVYRKSDGARVQTSNMETFWSNAGLAPVNARVFDPRILYDPYAKRWYAACADKFDVNLGYAPPNNLLFAVSNSSDPTAGWKAFAIDSDSNDDHWADFPMLGYNKDVVTLAATMYNVGTDSAGLSNTFVVIPKSDVLAPTPAVANAKRFEEFSNTSTGFAVQPAVDLHNDSLPLPLLSIQPNGAALKRNSVSGTPLTPSITTAGGSIPPNPSNVTPPMADQPGTTTDLDTGGLRARASVVKNNGELWAVNCVNKDGRAAVRWYRVNESNNTLIENGYIADPSLNFMFPSIAVNDFGDVVIGMSGSDANTYASALSVVGKTAGSGAGTTSFGSPFVTKAGVSSFAPLDGDRWGDYSATTNDPADPAIFWTIQEYVHATDRRATQVTEIIIPQPGEVRWKDPIGGAFDAPLNWFGGAAPTSSDHVIFSRATDPSGGGYTVSFGANQTVDRLSVRQGAVTLDLSGNTLITTNPADTAPSLAIGEYSGGAHLSIIGGMVIGQHAHLAPSPTASATLTLAGGAKLQIACDSVGGTDTAAGGDAVLNIDSASTLEVAQTLHVWDHGTVNFNDGGLSAGSLIVTGGRVNLPSSVGKVLRATDLQITNSGRIDLTTNAMVVDFAPANPSPLTSIRNQIASGYAGGTWSGPGITTSTGNANEFALGYADSSALGSVPSIFGPVDDTAVSVRYTHFGDANLDGTVNALDFNRLATNFGGLSNVWSGGDFNFDSIVNTVDFNFLATNFNQSIGFSLEPLWYPNQPGLSPSSWW